MISRKNIIVTRTPLRMSFAGGGTDLPAFYQKDYGAVLSMAINKYIYVTVKRHGEIFNEPVRLNYSKTELVINIDEIENDIEQLHVYQYKYLCKKNYKYKDQNKCAITQDTFTDITLVCLLPCDHIFISGPLKIWMRNNNICPICKKTVNIADYK